ncbi:nitrite reductase large subunit NirB [Flagellimonas halotolerans]|uniref:Nitrite reductase large subunit NirB n=1 Tax=Flagellimonas halotolerans TaxID=3112164 RepID=A0ABU6IT19_9FLAO|nr:MULTISPECIES: nitrite reductase large subunit NirB [unclassified Allomuricauda]MEC3966407.1 nitrite reductase large subunit NirB [Muricauda sp. SYSU M86414]MEC4266272.1 nitrite reductase large subunit NirB [Muricauda sp. SYSU M84420]
MKTIIVVGNGMVGYKFCEKFIASSSNDGYKLLVFGEEPRPAYDRVHLSEYFENQNAKALELAPASWYSDNGIELITGQRVTDIKKEDKEIHTATGNSYTYDYLVLATGSVPFVPPISGVEKEGVFVYRTIEDLEDMMAYASQIKAIKPNGRAAILGGGLLGLEAGKAVLDMGLEPHVVEFAPKLMPRQLDTRSSNVLRLKLESMGIQIHLSKATNQILGDKVIEGMEFGEDDQLDVDMLIISAGIRPRDELGKTCGLDMGTRGGIVVNNKMQTSAKDIFAIGEVALYNQMIYGLVAPGYEMADVAVNQILGNQEVTMPEDIDMSTKLKLMGVDVASFGTPYMPADKGLSIIFENKTKFLYKRINVSHDGKTLLGGILVGDAADYNILHQMYLNGMALPDNAEELIVGARGEGGSAFGSAMDLPDTAQICSCESVSKGNICSSLLNGESDSLKDIISCTKAATGCGGCKPMVMELVNETLKSMGKEVKDVICEHFEYTRQELYGIIKVKGITSYDEALDKCGQGDGCEVCKPALASIFATIYNDTANKEDVIQDSNDRFLANIQRNGSYSVVPRIPGGEITPEKLIVIGEVAKEFNLYTKITGGQRIDLFGAELNDLPAIWKKLIAAGFESGHAYGKSLRTVKSCVGSTWCRYGMDESVSFAIALEERYKGIRSPHKLKGGVSGCIRECAEARGKDFGVIAVEGGWNLYVCGNGGATPKHAQLLAEQIDNETVIKYLDRFLMYYIRTAAPLMRTAAWLEKLEGGIEQLKKVVIEDSLNIAEELEKDMQSLVDKYECEWKQAVENEEIGKRFKHFVNTDDKDDNLVFVPMREQKMPQPWTN